MTKSPLLTDNLPGLGVRLGLFDCEGAWEPSVNDTASGQMNFQLSPGTTPGTLLAIQPIARQVRGRGRFGGADSFSLEFDTRDEGQADSGQLPRTGS